MRVWQNTQGHQLLAGVWGSLWCASQSRAHNSPDSRANKSAEIAEFGRFRANTARKWADSGRNRSTSGHFCVTRCRGKTMCDRMRPTSTELCRTWRPKVECANLDDVNTPLPLGSTSSKFVLGASEVEEPNLSVVRSNMSPKSTNVEAEHAQGVPRWSDAIASALWWWSGHAALYPAGDAPRLVSTAILWRDAWWRRTPKAVHSSRNADEPQRLGRGHRTLGKRRWDDPTQNTGLATGHGMPWHEVAQDRQLLKTLETYFSDASQERSETCKCPLAAGCWQKLARSAMTRNSFSRQPIGTHMWTAGKPSGRKNNIDGVWSDLGHVWGRSLGARASPTLPWKGPFRAMPIETRSRPARREKPWPRPALLFRARGASE